MFTKTMFADFMPSGKPFFSMGSSGCPARVPLSGGSQAENRHDRHSRGTTDRAQKPDESRRDRTTARTLEIRHHITDKPPAESAEQYRENGEHTGNPCWSGGRGHCLESSDALLLSPSRVPAVRTVVVLPTYDEAANIAEVLHRVRSACPETSVLVVDDASPDGTANVVERFADEFDGIELLKRRGKSGLGSAYRDGFQIGLDQGFDVLVAMDSDLSHDPGVLPQLLGAIEQGADLAIGSRYVPGGSIPDWSWHRRLLSRWGNRYAGVALGMDIADATSGYRAFRASMIAKIDFREVRADGYGFQIEMAYRMLGVGGTVRELPIAFVDRVRGKSKMSPRIVIEALVLVTWWGVRDRLRRLLRNRS